MKEKKWRREIRKFSHSESIEDKNLLIIKAELYFHLINNILFYFYFLLIIFYLINNISLYCD